MRVDKKCKTSATFFGAKSGESFPSVYSFPFPSSASSFIFFFIFLFLLLSSVLCASPTGEVSALLFLHTSLFNHPLIILSLFLKSLSPALFLSLLLLSLVSLSLSLSSLSHTFSVSLSLSVFLSHSLSVFLALFSLSMTEQAFLEPL